MDVVALGELLIDFTMVGADSEGYPTMAAHPGGAVANFLAAIAKFGGETGGRASRTSNCTSASARSTPFCARKRQLATWQSAKEPSVPYPGTRRKERGASIVQSSPPRRQSR